LLANSPLTVKGVFFRVSSARAAGFNGTTSSGFGPLIDFSNRLVKINLHNFRPLKIIPVNLFVVLLVAHVGILQLEDKKMQNVLISEIF
jgi:hypothetical protein